MPEGVIQAAAEAAKEAGKDGVAGYSQHKKQVLFLCCNMAKNRELRKELLMAYTQRANNNNANDNKALINKIMKLRVQKAQLLGFETRAAFILDDAQPAKTPKTVYDFRATVWTPAVNRAKEEAAELQKLMDAEGKGEKLKPGIGGFMPKNSKAKYNLDEEEPALYFQLENVRQGAFDLAGKLFGPKFQKLDSMPTYHPGCRNVRSNRC